MIKTTKEKAIRAAEVIAKVKLDKTTKETKHTVIRLSAKLKRLADEHDTLLKEAMERLRPADYDALAAKRPDDYTPQEQETVRRYNDDIRECVEVELAKEIEIDALPLTEEEVVAIMESNPEMTAGHAVAIMDALCAEV